MSVRDLRSTKQDKPLPKDVLELIQSERYKDIISFFESCIVFSESRNQLAYIMSVKYARIMVK